MSCPYCKRETPDESHKASCPIGEASPIAGAKVIRLAEAAHYILSHDEGGELELSAALADLYEVSDAD